LTAFGLHIMSPNNPFNPSLAEKEHGRVASPLPSDRSPDLENQQQDNDVNDDIPVIKGLSWLDRLLALWILLAMVIGVLLGSFVEETGPALQKGKFVGVSIPIG
jgi:ACR3 family arsenite transporter